MRPGEVEPAELLPTRIRRLSNAEYDATVRSLTKTTATPGKSFSPDARQGGFTVNDAQRVDSVIVRQLFDAATKIAAEVKSQRLAELAPCGDAVSGGEACARKFIEEGFGPRAYRRALTDEEVQGLLAVYKEGARDATYGDGIEQVLRAVLQSAGLLYLTELGTGSAAADGTVDLTPSELASSLAYLVTGAPPDAALIADAEKGMLATPEQRLAKVEELRALSVDGKNVARERLKNVVREWLGTDRLEFTDKDANVYGAFRDLKPEMEKENHEFINAVLSGSASLTELLSANWSVVDAKLAGFYGAAGSGRVTLARRGILNQAAFLATYAHAHESAPVLRGVAIGRRVACLPILPPSESNVVVVVPPPDPTRTTRERFDAHSSVADCRGCHVLIDPIGFSFEQFDGMGAHRDTENGKVVDSATEVFVPNDIAGPYANSNELVLALADSPNVRECLARQMFRANAARSGPSAAASEEAFIELWRSLSEEEKVNISVPLLEFVKSPLFSRRRAQ